MKSSFPNNKNAPKIIRNTPAALVIYLINHEVFFIIIRIKLINIEIKMKGIANPAE